MKRVIIESPYAAGEYSVNANIEYAKRAVLHSLGLVEAPFASHLFYTAILDDTNADQRALGMGAGFAWGEMADLVAVYTDHGISAGMSEGMRRAKELGIPVELRSIK